MSDWTFQPKVFPCIEQITRLIFLLVNLSVLLFLQDVVAGDPKLNMAFVANLFNHHHCLPALKDADSSHHSAGHENEEPREETREERSNLMVRGSGVGDYSTEFHAGTLRRGSNACPGTQCWPCWYGTKTFFFFSRIYGGNFKVMYWFYGNFYSLKKQENYSETKHYLVE